MTNFLLKAAESPKIPAVSVPSLGWLMFWWGKPSKMDIYKRSSFQALSEWIFQGLLVYKLAFINLILQYICDFKLFMIHPEMLRNLIFYPTKIALYFHINVDVWSLPRNLLIVRPFYASPWEEWEVIKFEGDELLLTFTTTHHWAFYTEVQKLLPC